MNTVNNEINLNIHNIKINNFIIYNNKYIVLFPFVNREYFSNVEKDETCPMVFAKERVLVLVPEFGVHEMFDAEMIIQYSFDTKCYLTSIHDLETNMIIICNDDIDVISYDEHNN